MGAAPTAVETTSIVVEMAPTAVEIAPTAVETISTQGGGAPTRGRRRSHLGANGFHLRGDDSHLGGCGFHCGRNGSHLGGCGFHLGRNGSHPGRNDFDADVLSEATRPEPDVRILDWLARHEREIAVDPIILGEIRFGVLLLPDGKRRARLEQWFQEGVERIYCLPWEAATGLRWAQLLAELRAAGRSMPIKDSLIAATALVHGIPIATRNRRDFEKTGVAIIDPAS